MAMIDWEGPAVFYCPPTNPSTISEIFIIILVLSFFQRWIRAAALVPTKDIQPILKLTICICFIFMIKFLVVLILYAVQFNIYGMITCNFLRILDSPNFP